MNTKGTLLLKVKEEFFDDITSNIFVTSAIDSIENYKNFYINKYNPDTTYHHFIYTSIEFKKNDIILQLDETEFDVSGLKLKFLKIFYYGVFWISDCYFTEV